MNMSDSDVTLGELGRRLDHIQQDISSFRVESVLRVEFEAYKTATDREIVQLRTELLTMKAEATQAKQPWTSIIGAVATVVGLGLTILILIFVRNSSPSGG
jgi:hypothetical protein